MDKINVLRVRAHERLQETERRKSSAETLQKLQTEENVLDKALSEVEELRRINEAERSKLLVEAEQLFKRGQELMEKKALVLQARASLIDEPKPRTRGNSSASTDEVKTVSPPDSPADKGHAALAKKVLVPERTVSLKEVLPPTIVQATPRPPFPEARRPHTASGFSLPRAGSRTRPRTSSSTTGTLSSLWRRSSVTQHIQTSAGKASHDTSFGSSIASRRSSLSSVLAPFARRKDADSNLGIGKPGRDILSYYAQQGLEKGRQMQAMGQGEEAEEDVEEIANADIETGAQEESAAQRRMTAAYI